jgi:hypothetical protein
MLQDRLGDDLQEFLLGRSGFDGKSVEELDHQPSKSLEGTRDSDSGAHFDEDPFGGVNVDLKLPSLVDRRIKKSQEALVHR